MKLGYIQIFVRNELVKFWNSYNKLIKLNVKMERGLGRDLEFSNGVMEGYIVKRAESYPLELELHSAEFQLWEKS